MRTIRSMYKELICQKCVRCNPVAVLLETEDSTAKACEGRTHFIIVMDQCMMRFLTLPASVAVTLPGEMTRLETIYTTFLELLTSCYEAAH